MGKDPKPKAVEEPNSICDKVGKARLCSGVGFGGYCNRSRKVPSEKEVSWFFSRDAAGALLPVHACVVCRCKQAPWRKKSLLLHACVIGSHCECVGVHKEHAGPAFVGWFGLCSFDTQSGCRACLVHTAGDLTIFSFLCVVDACCRVAARVGNFGCWGAGGSVCLWCLLVSLPTGFGAALCVCVHSVRRSLAVHFVLVCVLTPCSLCS
jgi:hypothetical protein